jgi:hypothetical protein
MLARQFGLAPFHKPVYSEFRAHPPGYASGSGILPLVVLAVRARRNGALGYSALPGATGAPVGATGVR